MSSPKPSPDTHTPRNSFLLEIERAGSISDVDDLESLVGEDDEAFYAKAADSVPRDLQDGESNPDKEGWMLRKGQKLGRWKQRYYILNGDELVYFKNKNDPKPRGEIPLISAREAKTVPDSKYRRKFCFEICYQVDNAVVDYVLATPSKTAMISWLDFLRSSIKKIQKRENKKQQKRLLAERRKKRDKEKELEQLGKSRFVGRGPSQSVFDTSPSDSSSRYSPLFPKKDAPNSENSTLDDTSERSSNNLPATRSRPFSVPARFISSPKHSEKLSNHRASHKKSSPAKNNTTSIPESQEFSPTDQPSEDYNQTPYALLGDSEESKTDKYSLYRSWSEELDGNEKEGSGLKTISRKKFCSCCPSCTVQ